MKPSYPYADFRHINYWVGWMLFPPVIMTVIGLGHAMYSYALMTGLLPELPVTHLSHVMRKVINRDSFLQSAQIMLALAFVAAFCGCWLFLALRNQAILRAEGGGARGARSLRGLIPETFILGLYLMQCLGRMSALQNGTPAAERCLVPAWWALLIGAGISTAMGLLQLREPLTVGDWRGGYYWLLTAYGLYLAFLVLTWRLVKRLDALQRAYWQHRDAVTSADDGTAMTPF